VVSSFFQLLAKSVSRLAVINRPHFSPLPDKF
jgi:hypothetical protein